MSGSPTEGALPTNWPRVRVHPGAGLVDRRDDVLLVVPVLPATQAQPARELLELCRHPDPTGSARIDALRGLLSLRPSAEIPGFALLFRTGGSLRALVHGPVWLLVDGRARGQSAAHGGGSPAECVLEDGAWHGVTITADGHPADDGPAGPDVAGVLSFDLERGTVPGGGVTLVPAPSVRAQEFGAVGTTSAPPSGGSETALRPVVRFRTVLLGECALQASGGRSAGGPARPPLPIAGAPGEGAVRTTTTEPEVVVEGVRCPAGHVTDPERSTCLTCGRPCPPDAPRLRLPRPPLGILVTDGGTIYTVTGDFVIGREAEEAPDVLAGRARLLLLRDAARSTSRVHARLTVTGWKVLLSDEGSANGTFLSRSGAAGPWLPVTQHPPVALVHGDRMRLGKRQLLFDTWRETVVPQTFR
jgi:FHA domain